MPLYIHYAQIEIFLPNKVIYCEILLQQDCLTLSNVKSLLELGLEQHGQSCEREPVYTTVNEAGLSNLLMTCPVRLTRNLFVTIANKVRFLLWFVWCEQKYKPMLICC